MKKLITIFFLISFAINTYNAFTTEECNQEISLQNLNSKNIISYIEENNLTNKIMKICSSSICSDINIQNLEQDIKEFIERNLNYLRSKDTDTSLEAELKGFRIDKIIFNKCL